MGSMKGDSEDSISGVFNLKSELSVLVAKNIIPSRIAEKIEQKLTQKNITLTKDQLYKLAYKIKDAIDGYVKTTQQETIKPSIDEWEKPESDMKKLVDILKGV